MVLVESSSRSRYFVSLFVLPTAVPSFVQCPVIAGVLCKRTWSRYLKKRRRAYAANSSAAVTGTETVEEEADLAASIEIRSHRSLALSCIPDFKRYTRRVKAAPGTKCKSASALICGRAVV